MYIKQNNIVDVMVSCKYCVRYTIGINKCPKGQSTHHCILFQISMHGIQLLFFSERFCSFLNKHDEDNFQIIQNKDKEK